MNPIVSKWPFKKGLQDLGNGCYAYLQPDGSWGWSNAGLVVDSGQSLLVDTLFDLKLTREMLATMRRAEPAATKKSPPSSTRIPTATIASAMSWSRARRSSPRKDAMRRCATTAAPDASRK